MNKKMTLFIITMLIVLLSTSIISAKEVDKENIKNKHEALDILLGNYTKTNNTNFTLFTNRNETENEYDNNTAKFNKSRPIYFAMDHVNANDEQIRDTIVNKLKEEGFNVVSAEIGPNKMSSNTLYLYENNITGAIVFHLFNGVDPSTIRELATNGNDNRGRIVRSHGNDVVLAWFYDSVDCVNDNGTGINFVYGSETGPSLKNPKEFMDENNITAICTSSDMGKHKADADYTGEATVEEFIKLFK